MSQVRNFRTCLGDHVVYGKEGIRLHNAPQGRVRASVPSLGATL
jgi:hypothetical protein